MNSKTRPVIEILIADIFWGFGFIGTVWALKDLNPFELIFTRFTGAFLASFFWIYFRSKAKYKNSEILHSINLKNFFAYSFLPGFLLAVMLVLQSYGLSLGTTATQSSFITILYVVIVPLITHLLKIEKHSLLIVIWIFIALIGMALITKIKSFEFHLSDLLTLGCALFAAFHIVAVDYVNKKNIDSFYLNTGQALWCSLLLIPFLNFNLPMKLINLNPSSAMGLISLIFGSSLLAFYFQFKAQKNIQPTLAGLLFLLEAIFSMIFAYILLEERLDGVQMFGGFLIIFACIMSLLEKELIAKIKLFLKQNIK